VRRDIVVRKKSMLDQTVKKGGGEKKRRKKVTAEWASPAGQSSRQGQKRRIYATVGRTGENRGKGNNKDLPRRVQGGGKGPRKKLSGMGFYGGQKEKGRS